MRKIEMESWEQLMAAEIAEWEAMEALVAEDQMPLGEDCGVTYEVYEELDCGVKELARDAHRWELDPASAEDYDERMRGWRSGPAEKWRHFGH